MDRISVFVRRRRIKQLENWTIRAVLAEVFFLAIFPQFAAVAVVIGIVAWFLRLQIDKKFKLRSLPFDMPITIFVILGAISVFMSPVRSFDLIYNYCGIMGVFVLTYVLVGQNIRTSEQIKSLIKAVAVSAIIVVAVGFFQYLFGVDSSEMKITDIDPFTGIYTRIFSTFENPGALAEYLDIVICLALGLLAKFGTTKQKLIILAAIVILVFCLAMTYSRGAFLAIAAIFLIYGILYDVRILMFFALGTTILLYNDTVLFERVLSVFTTNDLSNGLRVGIWVSTISMIADHPFIGIGWGAYQFIYPQYDYYFLDMNEKIYHAHNLFLQTAAEVGIAGALAYFWYFFGTMFSALNLNVSEKYFKMKTTAEDFAKSAKENKLKQKFDEEFVKTVTESKFLQTLAQIQSMFILRMSELTHKIFDKFSKSNKTENKPADDKKSSPELVHHEEMKFDAKTKKAEDKKSDDDIDIQKFADNVTFFEDRPVKIDKQFIEGIRLGIGLAFLAVALNGLSVDSLFNVPIAVLMWILGALAASIEEIISAE